MSGSGEVYLVTGGLGCVGAWVVRELMGQGRKVVVFDASRDTSRLELVLERDPDDVLIDHGDIAALADVEGVIEHRQVTRIIHLAGLQFPYCKADPPLGAMVNVVGTVNLFDVARRRRGQIRSLAYASSIAVFDEIDAGDHDRPVGSADSAHPRSLYGAFKRTCEDVARVFWLDDEVPSIGLRPYVVYGPGRDRGITSSPTFAMAAAARGEDYHISYGGRFQFQHARDMATMFIMAADAPVADALVLNTGGQVVSMEEIIEAIDLAVPSVRGRITFEPRRLPFPSTFDGHDFEVHVGDIPLTPLATGVSETIEHFRRATATARPGRTGGVSGAGRES